MVLRLTALIFAFLFLPGVASAAPADDATAIVEQWVAAFNASDVDKIIATYTSDASVHGTLAPNLAIGTDSLRAYFTPVTRARNQVKMDSNGTATTLSPDHVVLAGFYEFSGTRADGQAFTAPARYTFVLVRRDGAWRIAHHHSSPRPRPAQ